MKNKIVRYLGLTVLMGSVIIAPLNVFAEVESSLPLTTDMLLETEQSSPMFYRNPKSNDNELVIGNIKMDSRFSIGDDTSLSVKPIDTTQGLNTSILDYNVYKQSRKKMSIKTDISGQGGINSVITMPQFYPADKIKLPVNQKPELHGLPNGVEVKYSGSPGTYDNETEYLKKHSWNDLLAIQIIGNTDDTFNIHVTTILNDIPELPVADLYKLNTLTIGGYIYSNQGNTMGTTNLVIAAKSNYGNNTFLGTRKVSDHKYVSFRDDIQNILPALNMKDISFSNFYPYKDFFEDDIYTSGKLRLDLTDLKKYINSYGLSVAFSKDSNSQVPYYTYGVSSDSKNDSDLIFHEDGSPYTKEELKGKQYVEIFEVLKTKPISITVGDKAEYKTMLESAISPIDGSSIIDNVEIDSSEVNTTKVGTYPVKFSCKIGDETITKSENITINPVSTSTVAVKYVDTTGEQIHDSQVINGNVGETYDVTTDQYKLAIKGYALDETKLPGNAKGTFTDKEQTVTYVYTKDTVPPAEYGKVIVKFVDQDGKDLPGVDKKVETGKLGELYSTLKYIEKPISGWTLDTLKMPLNAVGHYTKEDIVVSYVYTKTPNINKHLVLFDSNGGSLITPQLVQDGNLLQQPDQPVKLGYTFQGWYKDEKLTGKFNFSTPIKHEITLYAKWDKKDSKQEKKSNNGTVTPSNNNDSPNFLTGNKKNFPLPKTGEKNRTIFSIIGGIILVLCGLVYWSKNRTKFHKNK